MNYDLDVFRNVALVSVVFTLKKLAGIYQIRHQNDVTDVVLVPLLLILSRFHTKNASWEVNPFSGTFIANFWTDFHNCEKSL